MTCYVNSPMHSGAFKRNRPWDALVAPGAWTVATDSTAGSAGTIRALDFVCTDPSSNIGPVIIGHLFSERYSMSRRCALLVLAIAFLAVSAFSQTLPPGVQQKAAMGGITEYQFPNGLKVLLYPNAANPKVTINVTYLVGSRHEGYGETGMAHLLEHMNFIETTNGRKIKSEIVSHGANWNGTTSGDRTNYFETVPATNENLKWGLSLEADRMVKVKFSKQLLDPLQRNFSRFLLLPFLDHALLH